MARVTVTALFPDGGAAETAARSLRDGGLDAYVSGGDTSGRESGFIVRLVVIIAAASVVGTGAGAALGVLLSYTVGPHGTGALILMIVTWAIFAHLLIGMWAGYVLLADRSGRELGATEPELTTEADREDVVALSDHLRALGATQIKVWSRET